MRYLTCLLLLLALAACTRGGPAPLPPDEPTPPAAVLPTATEFTPPEVRATLIPESQLTRTPPPDALVSPLPPLEVELSASLVAVEHLQEMTIIRVQILPPASMFAPETAIILSQAELETDSGRRIFPTETHSLTSQLVELVFPPLEEEPFVLRVAPMILYVPAGQPLVVDLRGQAPGVPWDPGATLTFGGARVEVSQFQLVETVHFSTPSTLRLEITAAGGRLGQLELTCLDTGLPPGAIQGSRTCEQIEGSVLAVVDLGIPVGEDHPLLRAPFELDVSGTFDVRTRLTLEWSP
jgi:predicted small lipoprotein YifL